MSQREAVQAITSHHIYTISPVIVSCADALLNVLSHMSLSLFTMLKPF